MDTVLKIFFYALLVSFQKEKKIFVLMAVSEANPRDPHQNTAEYERMY